MGKPTIADDVRRFILTSVPSVPYLEALLLLRSERSTRWQASSLARRLYIGENHAVDLLQTLAQSHVARQAGEDGFEYSPAAPELAQVIDRLADTYASNLVGVTDLIHSRRDKRAHQFAGAFRWKRQDS